MVSGDFWMMGRAFFYLYRLEWRYFYHMLFWKGFQLDLQHWPIFNGRLLEASLCLLRDELYFRLNIPFINVPDPHWSRYYIDLISMLISMVSSRCMKNIDIILLTFLLDILARLLSTFAVFVLPFDNFFECITVLWHLKIIKYNTY